MKRIKRNLALSICLLISFVFWTIAVSFVDVQPIGPNGSSVGFSTINEFFHNLTGVNFDLYIITDWLGLVPVFICMAFAIVGLVQLISRKSLFKVDFSLLTLGVFYIVTIAVYFTSSPASTTALLGVTRTEYEEAASDDSVTVIGIYNV